MNETDTEPIRIASAEEMTNENFIRHMNARHNDSLGGMKELPDNMYEQQIYTYRAFHNRLHDTRVGLAHYHNDGEDDD